MGSHFGYREPIGREGICDVLGLEPCKCFKVGLKCRRWEKRYERHGGAAGGRGWGGRQEGRRGPQYSKCALRRVAMALLVDARRFSFISLALSFQELFVCIFRLPCLHMLSFFRV